MRRRLTLVLVLLCFAAGASAGRLVRVAASDPADGAKGVASRGLIVKITFNTPMDPATLTRETVQPGYADPELRFFMDPFLKTGYGYDETSRTLSVSMPSLLPEKEIYLVLTEGVRARDGRPLAGEGPVRHRLSFTTAPAP